MLHSIITTSYECYGKGAQFMRENLEAVISQTHRPLQCVVSDHSRDHAIEDMIKTLDPKGVDIVYVRYSENYGNAGENWNNGFKYATGQTLQYNCMDERLAHPNAIKDALEFMDKTGAQWIACSQITEPSNNKYVPFWNPNIINRNTISGPTAVIIRSSLKDVTLDSQFFYYIDTEWYYRLGKRAGPPVIFDSVTYIGRIHELQMTNTFSTPTRVELENHRLLEKYGSPLPTC
jgi:GT2 family glycosyltransferase